jgi:hypothetical protein
MTWPSTGSLHGHDGEAVELRLILLTVLRCDPTAIAPTVALSFGHYLMRVIFEPSSVKLYMRP